MRQFIPERLALVMLAIILSIMSVFHLLVILGVIPFGMIWGGQMKQRGQIILPELFSLCFTLIMLLIVFTRAGWNRLNIPPQITRIAFWTMFGIFILNTLGNLSSVNLFEKLVFAPLTAILSLLCLRLAAVRQNL